MITTQNFGKTGHLSTRIIFGAAALGNVTQEDANETLDVLLKYGINHIDTAAGYGNSELRIGPWMEKHRNKFFLATKVFRRSYKDTCDQIKQSLERLQVSSIDLIQLHNLTDPRSWKKVMGDEGALKALVEARDQGSVNYIGVTGHGFTVAEMHIRSLEHFDFDSVLLPYNYVMMQDQKYSTDFENLLNLCKDKGIAIQTIKSLARRPWGKKERIWNTWYEPFEDQTDIDRAVHWVLKKEGIFLNTSSDIHLLPKILDAASRFKDGPPDEEMKAIISQLDMKPIFDGRNLLME
ncbi:MAG: aldo/keto reductase [Candidatus Bathyarchaeota archaeon]|jgi:aryl-alcohol dehydrogenase-like predicted oxidoreductase|nr:aldo/keto reductase [Candidatus Bathyarchaeota archaeon]